MRTNWINLQREGSDGEIFGSWSDSSNNPHSENSRQLMTSNLEKEHCPKCGSLEVDANTPMTVYECGSKDFDQRPNTFKQSDNCKKMDINYKLNKDIVLLHPLTTNHEVFAIKGDKAYIGYKIPNGNFVFETIPYTEPPKKGISLNDKKEIEYKAESNYDKFKELVSDEVSPVHENMDNRRTWEDFAKEYSQLHSLDLEQVRYWFIPLIEFGKQNFTLIKK
jgi:hypothetical protein